MIRIFFTAPFYKPRIGGVGMYCRLLEKNLNPERFSIFRNRYDKSDSLKPRKRTRAENILVKLNLIRHLCKFPYTLQKNRINIVHSNPSLMFGALFRESFFILFSYLLQKKILVFIHGWNQSFAEKLRKNYLFKLIFVWIYKKADTIIVLATEFEDQLKRIGINSRIIVETTMVDDFLVEGCRKETITEKNSNYEFINLLFLSRIELTKGVMETILAFEILSQKYSHLVLNIAGEGSGLPGVQRYIREHHLKNVFFLGYVQNQKKKQAFSNAHIYILPSHGEGLPISVLEAITFGLPVVTRPVGGIKDFFIDKKHGFICDSKSPLEFSKLLEKLITDDQLRSEISLFNYEYGRKKFLSSVVAKRMESIYTGLVYPKN